MFIVGSVPANFVTQLMIEDIPDGDVMLEALHAKCLLQV